MERIWIEEVGYISKEQFNKLKSTKMEELKLTTDDCHLINKMFDEHVKTSSDNSEIELLEYESVIAKLFKIAHYSYEKKLENVEKNVLEIAEEITFKRAQEKEREYGPFNKSMEDSAKIASVLTGKDLSRDDFYKCMIALKMSRMAHKYKRDTFIDVLAYIGALSQSKEKELLFEKIDGQTPFNYDEEASE